MVYWGYKQLINGKDFMESYQLAKANIKILGVYYGEDSVWVRFSYQWRDKHHRPQWAEDVVSVPKKNKGYDDFGMEWRKPACAESVRAAVYKVVQDARAKLETQESETQES